MLGATASPIAFEMEGKFRVRNDSVEDLETTDSCGSSNSGDLTPQLYSTVPTNIPLITRPPVLVHGPVGSPARVARPEVGATTNLQADVFSYSPSVAPERSNKEIPLVYGPTATVHSRPSPSTGAKTGLPISKQSAILFTGFTTTPAQRSKAATYMMDPASCYSACGSFGTSVAAKPILCTDPCGSHVGASSLVKAQNNMIFAPAKVHIDDEEFANAAPLLMDPSLPLKKVYSADAESTIAGAAAMLRMDKTLPLKRQISNFLLTEPWQDSRNVCRVAPVFSQ